MGTDGFIVSTLSPRTNHMDDFESAFIIIISCPLVHGSSGEKDVRGVLIVSRRVPGVVISLAKNHVDWFDRGTCHVASVNWSRHSRC